MISVEITTPKFKDDLSEPIKKSLRQSALLVRRDAVKKTPYKTGTLRRSLVEKVYSNKAVVGTNLIYARIHELGGIIKPKNKPYLVFKVGGKWVRTKKVVIKKRAYLAPALEENKSAITKIFGQNIRDFIGHG